MSSKKVNMKIRISGIVLTLLIIAVQSCGQQSPGGIYAKFTEAYQNKDFALLQSLYEDDAFYLSPGGKILNDKNVFLAPIKAMFDDAEEKGLDLNISFRIVQRDYFEGASVDIGYYKLDWLNKEGVQERSVGKFITVARRQTDGSWRFRADGYSEAPEDGFFGN